MSSIFNPNGSIPRPFQGAGTQQAIISSTNATPIVIQQTGHGYQDQDTVEIEGHLVNTNANGVWQISVIDANHYALNGSVGNGVGATSGIATDYSVTPVIQIPGDGDLASSTNLMTPVEGVANAIPFLYRLAGKFRVYNVYEGQNTDPTFSSSTAYSTNTTYTVVTGLNALLTLGAPTPVFGGSDVMVIDMSLSVTQSSQFELGIGLGVAYSGGAFSLLQDSAVLYETAASSGPFGVTPIHLHSYLQSPFGATVFNTFQLGIMVRAIGVSTSGSGLVIGSWSISALHLRRN